MESRDIGIGIVMMVPSFVGGGAVWQLTNHSWTLVILWIIAMVVVYGGILKKKYSSD